jgi:hypothetical protein
VSVPVVILLSSLASREFRWRGALLNAAVLTLAAWLVFAWGLRATIPVWPGFLR